MAESLQVGLWRGGSNGRYVDYQVPRRDSQTVLDVVTWVQRHLDATLAYRFACRVGMCGSCAMTVNGRPRWTCRTHVSKVAANGKLIIGPLENLPIIKDLATDMQPFFEKWQQAKGRFVSSTTRTDPVARIPPDTPARVARMYTELFSGLHADPRELLSKSFTQKYDEVVIVKDIEFASMCEHHLLPFMGKAHIGYLPKGRIVGLSKLARVVEVLSHRPQVQERMTEELADLLMQETGARGVGVVLEATHTCMTIRGVRKAESVCTTSAMRGGFRDNASTRSEFLALVHGPR